MKMARLLKSNSSHLQVERSLWQPLKRPSCGPSAVGTSATCANCKWLNPAHGSNARDITQVLRGLPPCGKPANICRRIGPNTRNYEHTAGRQKNLQALH